MCIVHVWSRVASLPLTVSDADPWVASNTEREWINAKLNNKD